MTRNRRRVLQSLFSPVCPVCGCDKRPERAVCVDCLELLHPELRRPLQRAVGHGYEQAFETAMDWLWIDPFVGPAENRDQFWPAEPARRIG